MFATMINRMSKNLKAEAITAANKISIDGYTVSADGKTIDTGDENWVVVYYRCGEEVIAVPGFYIDEEDVSLVGSRNGEYTLNGDTLRKDR